MSTSAARIGIATLLAAFWLLPCLAQAPGREAGWHEDLRYFSAEFPSHQTDFRKLYGTAFDSEMAGLDAAVSQLTDTEIALRLMRLVASANVGHTTVYLPVLKLGFRLVPLSTVWYSDGLAVVAATPEYATALGTHVLRIGSMTPEQLLAAVAPYIPHENDTWLRQQSPGYMQMFPILRLVGAIGADDRVVYTLAKPGGAPFTLEVRPGKLRDQQVSMFDALPIPQALYRKQRTSFYWREYLADSRALYIQYNRCQNDPKQSFGDFARGLFEVADSSGVERVVIDLRFNGGGNSLVMYPLRSGLKSRPALGSHTYVLVGPGTFSSAQDNAIELRDGLHATLVGEPTGEKPNSYGEVRQLKLPNSQLEVQYSTRFFHLVHGSDPPALEPDIRVGRTLEDALAGRDPVLDAALRDARQK